MNQQSLTTLAKHRFTQIWQLYALIFIPMWLMFALNKTMLFGAWNRFGIKPREFLLGNIVGIFGSWTMHANFNHILGNSFVMAQILFLFGLFEHNAFRTMGLLIMGSGILTWLLGLSHSLHIGASGLAFAMMGYMIGGAIFARRWGYLVACVLMGAGFGAVILQGLIPQVGISFAGHFGGLIAGLLYGADSEKRTHQIGYVRK